MVGGLSLPSLYKCCQLYWETLGAGAKHGNLKINSLAPTITKSLEIGCVYSMFSDIFLQIEVMDLLCYQITLKNDIQ